jgi:hypothetical protein
MERMTTQEEGGREGRREREERERERERERNHIVSIWFS